jgi:hypothetical protein
VGTDKKKNVVRSQVFRSFRALGFPLTAEFEGLPEGGALPGTAVKGSSANSQNLGGFQRQVLNAAKRHSERVAADNRAFKNFEAQAKKSATASARLGATTRFFSAANSPISRVGGLANPKDNSFYSGIGGKMGQLGAAGKGQGKNEGETTDQKYGAVASTPPQSSFGGGSASGLGSSSSSNENPVDFGASFGASYGQFGPNGAGSDADASKELLDASKVTGMKESELKDMLDSANKNRDKDLQATTDDSLFKQVSKAYHRNLDRVLIRKKGLVPQGQKTKEIESSEKEEIKKLFK